MSIWKFLGLETGKAEKKSQANTRSSDTETVRKIVEKLDSMEPERARYIASFAYLLSRVAHADMHISKEETCAMERIVKERASLPEEQAILVIQMAKTQSLLFGHTENFLVTREFQKIAAREQKLALLDCLYAVSAADRSISTVEDNEIRKISRELHLSHQDFIAARLNYRDHLAVLKNFPKPEKA
ncbi:MAG: TerB family tellurite resistance protein [Acidobacteria bacterium]|nr:TerB family tellurite resistance protein [Acidobacteriota bacterium]MCZ6492364.1 TerB family tellurite resistance protein [Acidobacteriota bacterium]MCZ6750553.1 TerB family tellurite resistance protein [Acidobacteriota bacterium]